MTVSEFLISVLIAMIPSQRIAISFHNLPDALKPKVANEDSATNEIQLESPIPLNSSVTIVGTSVDYREKDTITVHLIGKYLPESLKLNADNKKKIVIRGTQGTLVAKVALDRKRVDLKSKTADSIQLSDGGIRIVFKNRLMR